MPFKPVDPKAAKREADKLQEQARLAQEKATLARELNHAQTLYRQRTGNTLTGAPILGNISGANDLAKARKQLDLVRHNNRLPVPTGMDLDDHDKALKENRTYVPTVRNQAQPPLPKPVQAAPGMDKLKTATAFDNTLKTGLETEPWAGPQFTKTTAAAPSAAVAPAGVPVNPRAAQIRAQLVGEGRIKQDGTVIPQDRTPAPPQDSHGVDYLNRLSGVMLDQHVEKQAGLASGAGYDMSRQGDAFAKLAAERAPAAPAPMTVTPNTVGRNNVAGQYGSGSARPDNGIAMAGAGIFDEKGKMLSASKSAPTNSGLVTGAATAMGPLGPLVTAAGYGAGASNIAGRNAAVASGAANTQQAPNNIAPSALTPGVNTPANPVDALPKPFDALPVPETEDARKRRMMTTAISG